jgi:hypothetical protein
MEERILRMKSLLDERQWRLYLANEAMSAGYGGVSTVSKVTGVSRTTITKGIEELNQEKTIHGKIRKSGGGPKSLEEKYPNVKEKVRKIVDGSTYGNPERVLSYTTESLRKIEIELESQGIKVSDKTIGKHTFPNRDRIYITCDSGGSNGYKVRMWKYQRQELANRVG